MSNPQIKIKKEIPSPKQINPDLKALQKIDEVLTVRPMKSFERLTVEDILLTTAFYGLFVLFTQGYFSFPVLLATTCFYIFRVFHLRHEKAHLPKAKVGKFWQVLTEYLWVYHTPYQETFDGKRWKHLAHHICHQGKRFKNAPTKDNPHRLLEQKNPLLSLLSALFYEEIMFYYDYKKFGKIREDRKIMFLVSCFFIALQTYFFGAFSFLCLFASYRLGMAIAWFSFSFALHIEPIYSKSITLFKPNIGHKILDWVLGSGATTALILHKYHHKYPLRYHKLN